MGQTNVHVFGKSFRKKQLEEKTGIFVSYRN